jgi:hypothetical protein
VAVAALVPSIEASTETTVFVPATAVVLEALAPSIACGVTVSVPASAIVVAAVEPSVTAGEVGLGTPEDRILWVLAESRVLTVLHEDRVVTIQ